MRQPLEAVLRPPQKVRVWARGHVALLLATLWPASSPAQLEESTRPHHGGVLVFSSANSALQWRLDGRVQIDGAYYLDRENDWSSGSEVRRARFGVRTVLHHRWRTELDVDLSDDEVRLRDAWIGWRRDRFLWRVGHFKEPFSLDRLTSSANHTFMESALTDALTPGRHLGLGVEADRGIWYLAAGVFGQEARSTDEDADEAVGLTGRLVAHPTIGEGTLVHLGLAVTRRTPDADNGSADQVRFRTQLETDVERSWVLSTGRISHARHHLAGGLETAIARGPLRLQAEYIVARVLRRSPFETAVLDGAYVQAAWLLSDGVTHRYVPLEAEFGMATPSEEKPAWEIALRQSFLDLNDFDAEVFGGSARSTTIALNYYANLNVRLQLNASHVNTDEFATGGSPVGSLVGDDEFSFVQMRWQALF